ncbi:MAG: glycosyltransferase family 4 protein [Armatimonadota bacterium]
MYILLATDFPPQVGGIQTYHSALARGLQQIGREVHVVATEHPDAEAYDATAPFPVTRVSVQGGKPAIYRRMREEIVGRGLRAAPGLRGIIATKWSPEGLGAKQAADRLNVPWGVFGHDREHILHGGNPLKWLLQQHLFNKANFCFAISNYAADNFRRRGVKDDALRMVGCGMDAELFAPDPERATALREKYGLHRKRVLLTVSRLVPRKGHLTVIEALPRIREAVGNVCYLIVGDGDYRGTLQEAVAQQGLSDHVIFAGRAAAEDLCGYYTLGDLMVMPSYDIRGIPTEGFGLTFLEANCCGRPVIGSRSGGIPDAVDHGLSGLLVPPRDPAAVAKAAIRILSEPGLAEQMGEYGQHRAREMFRWEYVARRVDAAFAETAGGGPA